MPNVEKKKIKLCDFLDLVVPNVVVRICLKETYYNVVKGFKNTIILDYDKFSWLSKHLNCYITDINVANDIIKIKVDVYEEFGL